MKAPEIADAVAVLAEQPFDPAEFPYQFLEAFGNKATTIKRLRSGNTNRSDIPNGVLQRNHIHIAVTEPGGVSNVLAQLRDSPETTRVNAKFILATDGETLEAQALATGELLAIDYKELANNFVMFLPLAGITIGRELKNSDIDIRATNGLNKLYVELLKENPDWGKDQYRADMNSFMARLIFSFFAEDTGIFPESSFTHTISNMSHRDASNVHEVITTLFRSMALPHQDRKAEGIPTWADDFPYVNGGLFSGEIHVPKCSRAARAYLLQVGGLNWRKINPDIFGSMTQAIADDDERGNLGMHYTSVPNILKVLDPLFLDELREQLESAGDNGRKLLNLRNRISRIRVFDPACGGGNFLVIAYKELRTIEAEINKRRNEPSRASEIPLTNFRGIEIQSFAAEIARLALIIAEYQCDELYRGRQLALNEFLPLQADNWITSGNALRYDWYELWHPDEAKASHAGIGLFAPADRQTNLEFNYETDEIYLVGNPPYIGSNNQTKEQKADLEAVFAGRIKNWRSLDYVTGWFMKAADYGRLAKADVAFVTTNSIVQGRQAGILWPAIFSTGYQIHFAHTSFRWRNLASHNAGVTVVIIGMSKDPPALRNLIMLDESGTPLIKETSFINAYLAPSANVIVQPSRSPKNSQLATMSFGNMPNDDGNLLLTLTEVEQLQLNPEHRKQFIRRFYGSAEFIEGIARYCIWLDDSDVQAARSIPALDNRIAAVEEKRLASERAATRALATRPHRFGEVRQDGTESVIVVPRVSSEAREYLPVGYLPASSIISDRNFALYDAPLWNMAIIASRLHLVWISTVCVRMRTDFSYSNTLGWNTFPVPRLTEQNKTDLIRAAEDILLAREAHFPATIAGLYAPDKMPDNLRRAHERNDEIIERIFIGRCFRNDTERLEKLFDLYQKAQSAPATSRKVNA